MASKMTTHHDEIRKWAEAHGGRPACIAGRGIHGGDGAMLRLIFPDAPFVNDGEKLRELGWDDWFAAFDSNGLALVYDPATRFNKIIVRLTAETRDRSETGASVHHRHATR